MWRRTAAGCVALVAACGARDPSPPAVGDAGPMQIGAAFPYDELVIGPADGTQDQPAVAWTGSAFLVVWLDIALGVRGALVGPDAPPFPAAFTIMSPTSGDRREPRVACTGGVCAVIWRETLGPDRRVWLRRVAADGALLDP